MATEVSHGPPYTSAGPKDGSPSVDPLQGDEIRNLRRLQREQGPSSHVFMTERDGPMAPKAFHALLGRIGARPKMPFPVHPHMLGHGCGYALANAGHDTRSLQVLPWPQEHSAHGSLHRAGAGPVSGLLAVAPAKGRDSTMDFRVRRLLTEKRRRRVISRRSTLVGSN
jgi:hypothetical protein